MNKNDLPILYVKAGCGWCSEATEFLDGYGIEYREKEVLDDPQAFEELRVKSGQTKAPTLDWHGKILADFDTDQLRDFLRKENVKFEDS